MGSIKMEVFMIGALGTGGVATHNKAMIKEMKDLEIDLNFYNYYEDDDWRPGSRSIGTFISHFRKFFNMSIKSFHKIYRRRKNIDVIHVQSSGPMGGFLPAIFGVFFSKFFNKKYIATFHHAKTEKFIRKHKWIFKFVIKNTDAFITVSKNQKEIIEKYYGKKYSKRIHPIPNGYHPMNISAFSQNDLRNRYNIDIDKKIFINIAWIVEKKGHRYLLEAIDLLSKKRKDFFCYVVGKGPLIEELNNMIDQKNISDFIEFLGYVPDDELVKRYIMADFFILPSLEEGNPVVMFEGLGLGLPFIGTDVGGIPEIINDDEFGLIVGSKDPKALAEAMNSSLDRDWNREKIREYSNNFTWKNIALQTIDVYNSL